MKTRISDSEFIITLKPIIINLELHSEKLLNLKEIEGKIGGIKELGDRYDNNTIVFDNSSIKYQVKHIIAILWISFIIILITLSIISSEDTPG